MSLSDYLAGRAPGALGKRTNSQEPDPKATIERLVRGLMRPERFEAARQLARALQAECDGARTDSRVNRRVSSDARSMPEFTDPEAGRDAWELCAARGLIPDAWIADERRAFHRVCSECSGVFTFTDPSDRCEVCGDVGVLLAGDGASPPDPYAAALFASDPRAIVTAEALGHELEARLGLSVAVSRWYCVGQGDVIDYDDHWEFPGRHYYVDPEVPGLAEARRAAPQVRAEELDQLTNLRGRKNAVRSAAALEASPALRDFLSAPLARESMAPLVELWSLGFGAVCRRTEEGGTPFLVLLAPRPE